MIISEEYYSNCLIEVLKAKIKNPAITITVILPHLNASHSYHFMWSDGKYDYDFGCNEYLKWYQTLIFKGHINRRELGFNTRWLSKAIKDYTRPNKE